MTSPRQMKLGAFFHPTGHHVAAWLHPEAQIDAGTNFRHYAQMTQAAERAKFDLVFLADAAATRAGNIKALRRWPQYMAYFEPTTLLSGLAALTERIGLVATATTSFNDPYSIARRYASLDHISGGRAGWNVVTSSNQAEPFNFSQEKLLPHAQRYARAREFVEVAKGLWDSWEDDAFLRDREQALYFDPEKLHALNHQGEYFAVRGPLNVARPPQGYPVLVQAGASDTGRDFAAEVAEIVFTAQTELEGARAFYADMKGRMAKFGRPPEALKIMPGLNPIIGRTEEEAREKHAYLQSLIHPDVGRELLSPELGGIDLSNVPVDEPLPERLIDDSVEASKSTFQRVADMARKEKLTVRQMYERYGGARGQRTVIGTPVQIADQMEEWFRTGAVDGFLIQPAVLPSGLDEFAATVVPELQRRGLFRTEYEGRTLRENLGLPRPAGRYAQG
ncbi:LLM class flavin-dependent oxidoreductase [Roseomonas sp. E05]|uniref:LLM class flavin-dependent oxidoreductase n=1 Tax=Roseomonas sp. E05 TaxID=3046310 RepID=UPI0024BBB45C|nr:LLM class flavin-dependent oxidoreductase [Roseomonas sp. E05]MDJ0389122.1 LLM class flavin-dependent oxidoreductase [Roseomonas sp. E05]